MNTPIEHFNFYPLALTGYEMIIPISELRALMSIYHYIIAQVILAFSLILPYDLLEDRRTVDVIITKFFTSVF